MLNLRHSLLLIGLSTSVVASGHHQHHAGDHLDPAKIPMIVSFIEDDIPPEMSAHDQQIIHAQMVEHAPSLSTVGTFIHIAGVLSSNKMLETIGSIIEHVDTRKSVHTKSGHLKLIPRVPSEEDDYLCPPNSPMKPMER